MGPLTAFLKEASKKKPDPHGFHPAWEPDVGWHPGGPPTANDPRWVKPKKLGQQKELFLWDQWKKAQTPEEQQKHMTPLLRSLRPFIQRHGVEKWKGNTVPVPVLRSEANRIAITGLEKFDPSRSQMNTFIGSQLKGMDRFTTRKMNLSRITDDRSKLVGNLVRAQSILHARLGREATVMELANEMKVDAQQVNLLLMEKKDDLLASGALEDPFLTETPETREIRRLLRYELAPEEELVYDYLYGEGGKPEITSTGAIAKKLGWKDSKVSQVKRSIAMKLKAYL
jgi:DNA-directed RNA polymerase specialized sigma subunit